jgi:hypothetical protein
MGETRVFTSGEWAQLVAAPGQVMTLVTGSSPSGPLGSLQELLAAVQGIRELAETCGDTLLMQQLRERLLGEGAVEDFRQGLQALAAEAVERYASPESAAHDQALAGIRAAGELVDTRGTMEEALEYKLFLMAIGQKAAEASREGGFLGLGAVRVSDAENTELDELQQVLQL